MFRATPNGEFYATTGIEHLKKKKRKTTRPKSLSALKRLRARIHHATVKDKEKTTPNLIAVLKRYVVSIERTHPNKARVYMDQLLQFEKGLGWNL